MATLSSTKILGNLIISGNLTLNGYNASNWDDAYTDTNEATDSATANRLMKRNSAGDVWARLFRSNYSSTNSDIAGIYTTKEIGGDYMRPSTPAQLVEALGLSSDDSPSFNDLTLGSTSRAADTTLSILAGDDHNASIKLYGSSQGTGRLFVGQNPNYGGGIEYNGDNSPGTTGAGSDYITLYRKSDGTESWTARNKHDSNNWEFRGDVACNTLNGIEIIWS